MESTGFPLESEIPVEFQWNSQSSTGDSTGKTYSNGNSTGKKYSTGTSTAVLNIYQWYNIFHWYKIFHLSFMHFMLYPRENACEKVGLHVILNNRRDKISILGEI